MGTPNKNNRLLVKSPKYSLFPISSDSKLTMTPGEVVPANVGYELFPGDEIDINLQQITRFLPTLAPVFQRYIIDYIPIFVPYRLLWTEEAPIFNSNKFFNPATKDSERPAMPLTIASRILKNNSGTVFGSLFDYLGFPTFTSFYERLFSHQSYFTFGQGIQVSLDEVLNDSGEYFKEFQHLVQFTSFVTVPSSSTITIPTPKSFRGWLVSLSSQINMDIDDVPTQEIVKLIPGSFTLSQLRDQYVSYIFGLVINTTLSNTPTATNKDLNLLPWLCYHRAISDWFLRSDLVDPDDYMSKLRSITSTLIASTGSSNSLKDIFISHSLDPVYSMICSGRCVPRMWMDDYFTTAMTSAQNDSAVPIPVNGTMSQLWEANRLQAFRMKVQLAGKRFIDQIRMLFGVEVPDYRLQRSEVLGHLKFNMVVSDVMQTSQSDIDSALGQFAGQAISSNGGHLLHYKAQEPGYLLVLTSVRPTTSYVDAVPRHILKSDYYDYLNPMYDNVGVQAISSKEVFYFSGAASIFGYTPRRYQEYMMGWNKISGQFKTSLDYWHAGRKFVTSPQFNLAFTQIRPEDGLNRIFADQSGDNVLMHVWFDAQVTRPLSRFVNYHM